MNWQHHLLLYVISGWALCASTAPVVDTSGWDWEALGEVTTTQPLTKPQPKAASLPTKPLPIPEPAPDFAAIPKPVEPLFPAMPAFMVVPSVKNTGMYPCGGCHRWTESNLTPRPLKSPHDNFTLKHGLSALGQLWCFTCHDLTANDRDGSLHTIDGKPVNYAESYVVCTQCHAQQGKDWAFGAHGKRVENWQGERKVYNCTACHYPHAPAIKTRVAEPGPQIRHGLPRPAHWVPKAESIKTVLPTSN